MFNVSTLKLLLEPASAESISLLSSNKWLKVQINEKCNKTYEVHHLIDVKIMFTCRLSSIGGSPKFPVCFQMMLKIGRNP